MRLHTAVLALALAAPSLAWSQAPETPERVLRLSYVEGDVGLQAANERAPISRPDRPLIPGDRLITQNDGRAELALDTSAIRLDESTELRVETLDAMSVRMDLRQGVASLRLGELLEGETFEIETSNASITLREPGEYRVEIAEANVTVLTVRDGAADVATAAGPVRIAGGQRVRLEGHEAHARLEPASLTDDFDDWVLEREVQLAETQPASYGFEERDRYDELDRNGDWYDDSSYGRVWISNYGHGSWDQFSHGRWQRHGYGWSWVSAAPWGYLTFHSGRWAYLNDRNRWCWVPGQPTQLPSVARETHPFGKPSRGTVDSRIPDYGNSAVNQSRAQPGAQPSRGVPIFNSGHRNSSPQPAATMPSSTATMRPSGSSNTRTSAPSSAAPRSSVFAVPKP